MFWHRANTEGLSGMCKGVTRKGRQLCAVCQRWDARGGGGCHMSHFSSVLLCTLHMLHQLVLTTLPFRRWENRAPALGFISLSLWSNPFFWLEGIKLIRPRAWLSPFPNPRLSGSWCSGLLIQLRDSGEATLGMSQRHHLLGPRSCHTSQLEFFCLYFSLCQ